MLTAKMIAVIATTAGALVALSARGSDREYGDGPGRGGSTHCDDLAFTP